METVWAERLMLLTDLFEHALLDEGRDSPIYHGTNWWSALEIIKRDIIQAKTIHVPKINNTYQRTVSGVSFSRDIRVSQTFGPVVFVFDQAKMVRNHKLVPIDFWGYSSETKNGKRRRDHYAEAEEFLIGPLKNMSRYLIEIQARWKDVDRAELEETGHIKLRYADDEALDHYDALAFHPLLKWNKAL